MDPPLTNCKGPNDEVANEQQNLAHNMYLLTLDGKLHLAPLDHPQVRFLSDMLAQPLNPSGNSRCRHGDRCMGDVWTNSALWYCSGF